MKAQIVISLLFASLLVLSLCKFPFPSLIKIRKVQQSGSVRFYFLSFIYVWIPIFLIGVKQFSWSHSNGYFFVGCSMVDATGRNLRKKYSLKKIFYLNDLCQIAECTSLCTSYSNKTLLNNACLDYDCICVYERQP